MSDISHQTVRLSRGRHRDPAHGACVMELASMLAGEPFDDHPRSVCPVIGAFLRSYNDCVDAEHRGELYAVAARVVGTSAGAPVQARRIELCERWTRAWYPKPRLDVLRFLLDPAPPPCDGDLSVASFTGRLAAKLVRSGNPAAPAAVLELLDRMIECSEPRESTRQRTRTAGRLRRSTTWQAHG